jgi:hypothetical protein
MNFSLEEQKNAETEFLRTRIGAGNSKQINLAMMPFPKVKYSAYTTYCRGSDNPSRVGREAKNATEVDEQARARLTINKLSRAKSDAELTFSTRPSLWCPTSMNSVCKSQHWGMFFPNWTPLLLVLLHLASIIEAWGTRWPL